MDPQLEGEQAEEPGSPGALTPRAIYDVSVASMRLRFQTDIGKERAGLDLVRARSAAVDRLISSLWQSVCESADAACGRIALVAVGGYGRQELFPFSDIDLMFLLPARIEEASVSSGIRQLNQELWDAGLRVSPVTRNLAECERFAPENAEFTLALLDSRLVCGDAELFAKLSSRTLPRLVARDRKRILKRLAEVTRLRHARYGDTLFHLEPNIKDCPGGLRDAHVYGWLRTLAAQEPPPPDPSFEEARAFLLLVRVFLHLRHGRDSNVLDWQAQDDAASQRLGVSKATAQTPTAEYWMRLYFRHARSVERTESLLEEEIAPLPAMTRVPLLRKLAIADNVGFELAGGRLALKPAEGMRDPAHDPEVMLALFGTLAATGARLAGESATRLEGALPVLSSQLEDGHGLWLHLRRILLGRFAGQALRTMHQLGILELVLPEFHGIDALVIRDAYHRYTVDEHTFVLIDTLHSLELPAPERKQELTGLALLHARFAAVRRDLPHPELLYLAALLHDVGKAHAGPGHAAESARMATRVLASLELETREASQVLALIRNHLEMSAALRRDVFDAETVRTFAATVSTPESLRMLALFTYADISAVHPDALTPWKAENLLALLNNTTQYLDRLVDGQRIGPQYGSQQESDEEADAALGRVAVLMPGRRVEVDRFLAGLPRRYLLTREPSQVRADIEMAARIAPGELELSFRYGPEMSELTVMTQDRSRLFADIAGILAGWGMNIVSANAFSNAEALVVDSFRFTDTYRTLELNESERERFVQAVRQGVASGNGGEQMLRSRRKRARTYKVRVENRVDFDEGASLHSTLVQVAAQDTPGLLYTLANTFVAEQCNIEVALVDTEGEMAIDVFYLTRQGRKLDAGERQLLGVALLRALEKHGS